MRLRLAAEVTDWDAELAWLEGDEAAVDEAPVEPTDSDPEAAHFRALARQAPRSRGGRRRGVAEARSASSSEKYTASDLGGRSAVTLVA